MPVHERKVTPIGVAGGKTGIFVIVELARGRNQLSRVGNRLQKIIGSSKIAQGDYAG